MEYQKTQKSLWRWVLPLLLLVVQAFTPVTARAADMVLVGGSDFLDKAHSDTLWNGDLNLIETVGPDGSKFSSAITHADSAQMFQDSTLNIYAVTTNPHLLDSTYVDKDQNMLVVHIAKEKSLTTWTKLLSYKIDGLEVGSKFKVTFKLWGLNDTLYGIGHKFVPWDPWQINVGVDLDQYGVSDCEGDNVKQTVSITPGNVVEVTLEGTLKYNYLRLDIANGDNYKLGSSFGISDLRVYGTYKPHVKSSMGIEVCAGEQALISLDKEYNADSYKWYSSTDGKTFASAGSKKNLYEQLKTSGETYYYYCIVNGLPSDTIAIKAITCCVDGEGHPMSRMDVFYDDFGYFDDLRSYTDAFGNSTVFDNTYAPERADVTFDLSATGMTFDKSGQINDTRYGVVVPSSKGYYQDISGNSRAEWMAGVSSDHSGLVSGKSGGGALFMNVTSGYSGLIFTRTIDGLCTDKNIYFEIYIANMSGGFDPEVTINIKDATTGKVLKSDKQTATAGAGWIRVHIDELQVTSSSIVLEIESTGTGSPDYWLKGNDLIIDDIRFMVCSPPSVDIYSNLESFAGDTTICANTDFTMGSQVSDLLNSFFKGEQKYLFQQSIDGETWSNMGAISEKPTYTFNTEKYPADTNYFRVVVANEDALQQFLTNPSKADYEDKCRSYSISKSFKIIRAGAIDMGEDQKLSACGGVELTLNGSNDGTLTRWGWEDADGNVLVATTSDADAKQYVYKVTDDAKLTFVGYNKDGCLGKRNFTITKQSTVEFELADSKECALTTITATGAPKGAEFKWIYGDTLTETGSSVKLDTSYSDGTIKAVATATGYCESDTVSSDVTIWTFPDAPVPVKTLMSEQVKAGATVSLEEMVSSTDGIEWSEASNGKFTDTWKTDVPSQSLAKAGTYIYWIRSVSENNCPSDTVRLTVVINEAPMPEVRNDTVCIGTEVDLTKYITKSDEGFTLVWYPSVDGKGTENPNNFIAENAGTVDYWVSQKSDAAESEKAHIQVVVAGVAKPVVDEPELVYCLNDDAAELSATVTSKPAAYTFATGTEWRVGDDVTTDLKPSTVSAGETEYSVYGVFSHPTTLNGEAVCYSEPTTVKVTVVETPAPTSSTSPEFTYSYVKADGDATGSFADVLTASSSKIAVPITGNSLVWYDADGNKLDGAPAPPYDANQETDMTYTYQVSQIDANGCESEKVKITINVNGTPTPNVKDSVICFGDTYLLTSTVTTTETNCVLKWYTSETGGTASDDAPDLSREISTPGLYTFYVSQYNNGTNAESRRVPVNVTAYGVKTPTIVTAETTYCKGATPVSLNEMVAINKNVATYYEADADLVWTADGAPLTSLVPSTAATTTSPYTYGVSQTYTLTSGEVCKGETVYIKVNVTEPDVPATSAVNYLKTDAADNGGSFKNLLEQNAQAAVASTGCHLNWYDSNKTALSSVPTPAYDATLEGDLELTYYVSQSDDVLGCESDLTPVTVTISSSPMPTTEPVAYCEGDETATALTAKVSLVGNGDTESDYTLVWYGTQNPNDLATEAEKAAIASEIAPIPSTAVTNGETFQIYTYYVAQKRVNADGKEVVSRATALIDSVYAKPQLITADPAAVCYPQTVDLSSNNLWSVKAAKVWAKAYSQSTSAEVSNPTAIAETGTFNVSALFYVRGNECKSDEKTINVTVDYIKGLAIEGDDRTCPGKTASLSAKVSEVSPAISSYNWSSSESGENVNLTDADFTTTDLAGPSSRTYTYQLTATAGACVVTADKKQTITIGDGPISGTVDFAEDGNSESATVPASVSGLTFYSCGNKVTVTVDLENTDNDFVWTAPDGTTSTGKTLTIDKPANGSTVYKLAYTNSCLTGFDVTIVGVPVVATLIQEPATNLCEGDNFSAELSVTCPENTYKVAWYQDGVLLPTETASTLSFSPAVPANNGVYTYEVTNRGCKASGEVAEGNALTVRPYIQLTYERSYIARRDSQLTIPLNITTADEPSSIRWTEGGVDFATGNPLNLKVTADHNFKVVLSDADYCDAEANIAVQMDARLQMKVSLDNQICAGDAADLVIDTTGTGKFIYSGLEGIKITETCTSRDARVYTIAGLTPAADGKLHFSVTPPSDATYEVLFFYRQPTDGVDYQSITVKKSIKVLDPVSIIAPTGLAMCGDGESTLDVTLVDVQPSGVLLTWDDDASIMSSLDGSSIEIAPTFDEAQTWDYFTKTYTVRGTYSICSEVSIPVKVTVYRPISGQIVASEVICEGSSATIDASAYRAYEYEWTSESDTAANGALTASITVTPEYTSTYNVSMTRGECSATDEYTLEVSEKPEIVSVDSVFYNKRDVVVGGGATPYTYWLDNNQDSASVNSLFTGIAYGKHTAHVIDAAGCTADADFNVIAPGLKIPIILSPNKDGVNDAFSTALIQEAYPTAKIRIFDRWGKKLVEYQGSDEGWDGTYNGNAMPSTDYWYEIEIKELKKTYTGHFTLMRQ